MTQWLIGCLCQLLAQRLTNMRNARVPYSVTANSLPIWSPLPDWKGGTLSTFSISRSSFLSFWRKKPTNSEKRLKKIFGSKKSLIDIRVRYLIAGISGGLGPYETMDSLPFKVWGSSSASRVQIKITFLLFLVFKSLCGRNGVWDERTWRTSIWFWSIPLHYWEVPLFFHILS